MYLLCLNTRKQSLGLFEVCHGQVDQCTVSAREIYLRALISGANSVILAHNHPAGSSSPSEADKAFTQRMKEAGELLDIRLDDSIIISTEGCFSFMESGLL